jgi:hypothetical protein
LNGNLVRLGWARDCVHEQAEGDITIGFGLDPAEISWGRNRPSMAEVSGIDIKSRFSVASDNTNFTLANTDVSVNMADETGTATVGICSRSVNDTHTTLLNAGLSDDLAKEYTDRVGLAVTGDVPAGTVGSYPAQFLPNTLAVVINAHYRELNELLHVWLPRIKGQVPVGVKKRLASTSPQVAEFLGRFLLTLDESAAVPEPPNGEPLSPSMLADLPVEVLKALAGLRNTAWYAEHSSDLPFHSEVDNQLMVGAVDASVDCARAWFSTNLHHLGPLRAAPQPLYGLPEAPSEASVGKNGEYTAAVLNTYGRKLVQAPLPEGGTRKVSLTRAVDSWVKALGLLASVKPIELGKYGYELTVNMEGVDRALDLTTVGVGVSQALPIIVLGLIAEPGSLLLFEQPELHLHPDVQAALGDFFVALARSGRQLIIETHSEYLINRFRRRQATDSDPDVAELTRLFFFERADSAAKVTPAQIGEDGSMPGWPSGFLDTAAREIEATVLGRKD